MRIVYMGTPDFAVPALEKIVSCGWDVPLVVTKPDRPASRGHKIQQCDVKKKALELGLAVESPEKVKNGRSTRFCIRFCIHFSRLFSVFLSFTTNPLSGIKPVTL